MQIKKKLNMKINMNTYNNPPGISGWVKSTACGIAFSIVIMLVLAVISSGIIYFGDANEIALRPLGAGISVVALFIGGFAAARAGRERGILRGLAVGGVFCLILLIAALVGGGLIPANMIKCVYYLIAGAIGGVCGIR